MSDGVNVIECRVVDFSYRDGGVPVSALRGVSLALAAGESVAILGPTGSGKSTLLQVVRGLLDPDGGEVRLSGQRVGTAPFAQRQRRLGLVFQRPELQLFAATVWDDVAFGPRQFGRSAQEVDEAVEWALTAVGLPSGRFARRHPYSLSGGEQRRAAIAGVLATRPDVLLLDEPFVGLDPQARRELAAVLTDIRAAGGALMLATHDVDLAWELCDRRFILDQGRVVAAGPWDFGAGGEEDLTRHRLRAPFLVELWHRLGRPTNTSPRSIAAAAEALA